MADIEVLAEYACEVTACKEYRTGTARADQDRLFAEMGANRANFRDLGDTTITKPAFGSVDSTVTRAYCAGIHSAEQPADRFAERIGINRLFWHGEQDTGLFSYIKDK